MILNEVTNESLRRYHPSGDPEMRRAWVYAEESRGGREGLSEKEAAAGAKALRQDCLRDSHEARVTGAECVGLPDKIRGAQLHLNFRDSP